MHKLVGKPTFPSGSGWPGRPCGGEADRHASSVWALAADQHWQHRPRVVQPLDAKAWAVLPQAVHNGGPPSSGASTRGATAATDATRHGDADSGDDGDGHDAREACGGARSDDDGDDSNVVFTFVHLFSTFPTHPPTQPLGTGSGGAWSCDVDRLWFCHPGCGGNRIARLGVSGTWRPTAPCSYGVIWWEASEPNCNMQPYMQWPVWHCLDVAFGLCGQGWPVWPGWASQSTHWQASLLFWPARPRLPVRPDSHARGRMVEVFGGPPNGAFGSGGDDDDDDDSSNPTHPSPTPPRTAATNTNPFVNSHGVGAE